METSRNTIKQLMLEHTKRGGYICAQSLCGVGGVQNTISLEDKAGLVELSISDSSNPSLCVGMALSKPTVYIIRFSGFGWLNFWPIVNYAAKCKELWGYKCRLFVRCMIAEDQIGPVASNANHSIIGHMPGIQVVAPMTPLEYKSAWYSFKDNPVFCSESRLSYDINHEIPDLELAWPDVCLIGISSARLECQKACETLNRQNIKTNFHNLVFLKPLDLSNIEKTVTKCKFAVIVDSDFTPCGISEHIALTLSNEYRIPCYALGLDNRVAGFAKYRDNITPKSDQIIEFIKDKYAIHK